MSAVATSPTAASVKLLRSSNEDCPLEWLETEADATPAAKRAQAAMVGKLVWARGTWGTSVLVALADVPTETSPRKRSSSRSVHGSGCESSPIRPAVVCQRAPCCTYLNSENKAEPTLEPTLNS